MKVVHVARHLVEYLLFAKVLSLKVEKKQTTKFTPTKKKQKNISQLCHIWKSKTKG